MVGRKKSGEIDVDAVIWARTIALRVMMIRKSKRITQDALAKAVGLTRTSIVNIEAHNQSMSLTTLWHLARALGVPVRKLLP
jgi:DNA-binding XRE family transcriptional regulator